MITKYRSMRFDAVTVLDDMFGELQADLESTNAYEDGDVRDIVNRIRKWIDDHKQEIDEEMEESERLQEFVEVLSESVQTFIRLDLVKFETVSIGPKDASDTKHFGATLGTMKLCPFCSEWAFSNAEYCPECGNEFTEVDE